MGETLRMTAAQVCPSAEVILDFQGVPESAFSVPRNQDLAAEALALFGDLAEPVGLTQQIAAADFAVVYRGRGENAPRTPVELIYPRATDVALFAVTVGPAVCDRISQLFAENDYALGAMLDAAASEGAERAADFLEAHYREHLESRSDDGTLRFSPGYCGWNVSGQTALFARLRPDQIGIALSESCLMHPLKSVSGVILTGPGDIFEFTDDFPFCDDCDTHSCRERIDSIERQS